MKSKKKDIFEFCQSAEVFVCKRNTLAPLILLLLVTNSLTCFAFTESENIVQNNCRECHGIDGKAKAESWPNLNCQNRGYLYSRLIKLKNSSDHNIDDRVKSLSTQEIDEISRYYSEQKCSSKY